MYVTVVFKTALNMHISSFHMTSVQVTAVNMMVVYVTVCVTAVYKNYKYCGCDYTLYECNVCDHNVKDVIECFHEFSVYDNSACSCS